MACDIFYLLFIQMKNTIATTLVLTIKQTKEYQICVGFVYSFCINWPKILGTCNGTDSSLVMR